ncbi:NADPH:quinone reductase [Noviherbaspirillum humi]|uniref:NADPH:quinone reductase n=1 Tax=Noviherbaspirillum humi TaxID=1688639 RepID=A0A239LHE4_9BURK|nr:zinc-binding dehydrogenase [Noviherbaspirillum humi]SNT30026.1 NADPH:quinone reductase [Noviherbaspirillum humi]
MRAWWLLAEDGEIAIEMREQPAPAPGPRQLLLRMRAAGLNRGEFIAGHGLSKTGTSKPAGIEGAGEVVAAGAEVAAFKAGDRVFGRLVGAFAEFALMDVDQAIAMPEALSWEQAACVPVTYMTAHEMLVRQGRLMPGQWLLVTGAASGIGVASLQIAKAIGASVAGTSGNRAKLAQLEALGLDLPLCTRGPDFCQALMDVTGGAGVNLVVNTVGGSVFAECIRSMAFEGRLATVGYVDGVLHAELDIAALHSRRLVLFGVSNKMVDAAFRAAATRDFAADIVPLLAAGKIKPVVDQAFALPELAAAKAYMESNQHLGKLVVTI